MTEDELKQLLNNEDLLRKIDVRTLILDYYMKQVSIEEIIDIFHKKLPEFDESYVRRFIYMKRG